MRGVSAQGQAGWLDAGDQGGECPVDVRAEVPVAGVVEAVDAAFGVDGEHGLVVAFVAEGATSVSSARPRSASVRARCSPARGSKRTGVGAVCRPGPGAVTRSPPNSAQASTAAGKTVCRWPPGETCERSVSAQCSASLMSQRPGCHPASRRAASTATGNRVVLRWSGIGGGSAVLGCGRIDGAYSEVVEHGRTGAAGWCVAAVQRVAVLPDPTCRQLRLFQGSFGFAVGEWLALCPF